MNPTHEPDNNPAQTRAFGENFLVDLFTSKDRFRAWIASAIGTAARPVTGPAETDSAETDSVGYSLTESGRAALAASASDEPVAWVAVRGWCEICGNALPWVCTWEELLCSDCVIVVPAEPEPSNASKCQFCGRPGCYPYCESSMNGVRNCGPSAAADESTCPVDLVTETTGRVLEDAATYLERHGWIQGSYYDATSGGFTPPACMVGAIGMVCYGGPVDAPAQHFDDPGFLDFDEAVLHLDRYLLAEDSSESYEFNDAKGRRLEDVIHVLRDAAKRPAHELIDALRVIDKMNADTAALAQALIPGATWDDPLSSDGELANIVDCQFCGAPGGYPYCQGSFNGQMSCADVVAADDAELGAEGGDAE